MYKAHFTFPDGFILKREYIYDVSPKCIRCVEHGYRPIRVDYFDVPATLIVDLLDITVKQIIHPLYSEGVHLHVG